jgi:hypothetical protein
MPAVSYKEQFVPFVKNFSKRQTIRAFRKNYLFKPGKMLSHYYGMRTKFCTKLIEPQPITDVQTIWLLKDGTVALGPAMEEKDARHYLSLMADKKNWKYFPDFLLLRPQEKNYIAFQDGFRAEGTYINSPTSYYVEGCFDLMFKFWNETHSLPFTGQIIYW